MSIERRPPSVCGIDADGVLRLLDALEADDAVEPHGLIVQRGRSRAVEGYWAPHAGDRQRLIYSLSKTFTGTALALQLGEGRLGLDDLVVDHLPELFAGAPSVARRIRVRHLASMSTGHDREMLGEALLTDPQDPVRAFFHTVPEHEPGTWFAYNQPPVLALARILERLTGERLVDYLRPRLLEPVGISPLVWQQTRLGGNLAFTGVHATLDDVARLGQLYLDDGIWDGQRILPEGWVQSAGHVRIPSPHEPEPDWREGYGYLLWMSRHGYRGDGGFGQFMMILPEHDTVVAYCGATTDMQKVLDLFWELLLPALAPSSARRVPALADDAADQRLQERLASLRLPTIAARNPSARPVDDALDSASAGTFLGTASARRAGIDQLTLLDGTARVSGDDGGLTFPLTATWTTASWTTASAAAQPAPFAANAATVSTADGDTELLVDVASLETPHRIELRASTRLGTLEARWATPPFAFTDAGDSLFVQRARTT